MVWHTNHMKENLYIYVSAHMWKGERQGPRVLSSVWMRVGVMTGLNGWVEMGVFR